MRAQASGLALAGVIFAALPGSVLAASSFGLGKDHSCAIVEDGALNCWGRNDRGQVGDGTTADRPTPQRVANLYGVIQVTGGASHTCALKSDTTVACWGDSSYGQLGDYAGGNPGKPTHSVTPSAVAGLNDVVEIAAGAYHTCARKASGAVWCWGRGNEGQLGNGYNWILNAPSQVVDLPYPARKLAGGQGFSCAILDDGAVWCWGDNTDRQLGREPADTFCWAWACKDLFNSNRPLRVPNIPYPMTKLALGFAHACATNGADMWCWGRNSNGQLGNGAKEPSRTTTRITTNASDIVAIEAGTLTTYALRSDGTLLAWGSSVNGQYGNGRADDGSTRPVATTINLAEIAAGAWHVCGRWTDGRLLCWGLNFNGQVGDGSGLIQRTYPSLVAGMAQSHQVLSVSRSGSGNGTVVSNPAGIKCQASCSASFQSGTWVTLTATPDAGSTFAGWSGACSGTGVCSVAMDGAKSVAATFDLAGPQIGAVVDGTNYSPTVYPGTTITIYGSGFSIGGNSVLLQRSGYAEVWLYSGDGRYFWDYNGTQINASLDNRLAAGTWTLWVRNASGAWSGAYNLTIQGNATSSSTAAYCYSAIYPWNTYGFQQWLCAPAYQPTYCYTANWQQTSCPR